MLEQQVIKKFKELKIGFLAHVRDKNENTITERDIKIFLLLIHYPGMSAIDISKCYKQIKRLGRESFRTADLVRTALSNLKAKGFVKSIRDEDDQRKVRWYIDEGIITQSFISYDKGNPKKLKDVIIEPNLLKEGLKLIQLCSQYQDEATSQTKIIETIESVELRDNPTQIHAHITTMIEYIVSYLKKQIIQSNQQTEANNMMDMLIRQARNINEETSIIEELMLFRKQINQSVSNPLDNCSPEDNDCPLILKNMPKKNIITSLFRMKELHSQLVHYVKEFYFVSSMVK